MEGGTCPTTAMDTAALGWRWGVPALYTGGCWCATYGWLPGYVQGRRLRGQMRARATPPTRRPGPLLACHPPSPACWLHWGAEEGTPLLLQPKGVGRRLPRASAPSAALRVTIFTIFISFSLKSCYGGGDGGGDKQSPGGAASASFYVFFFFLLFFVAFFSFFCPSFSLFVSKSSKNPRVSPHPHPCPHLFFFSFLKGFLILISV